MSEQKTLREAAKAVLEASNRVSSFETEEFAEAIENLEQALAQPDAPAAGPGVPVPVAWLEDLREGINTLATLSLKAERHAVGAGLKRGISAYLAAAPAPSPVVAEQAGELPPLPDASVREQFEMPHSDWPGEQFEEWWQRAGQYSRAGGGGYEKTFAFNAAQYFHALGRQQGAEQERGAHPRLLPGHLIEAHYAVTRANKDHIAGTSNWAYRMLDRLHAALASHERR